MSLLSEFQSKLAHRGMMNVARRYPETTIIRKNTSDTQPMQYLQYKIQDTSDIQYSSCVEQVYNYCTRLHCPG